MSINTNKETNSVEENPLAGLTSMQRDMLRAIDELDEPCGRDVMQWLEENGVGVTHGSAYPNLDTLVNKGLVERGKLSGRANWYALSEKGQEARSEYVEWVTVDRDAMPFGVSDDDD